MEFGRKIAIIGRSLENTVEIASNLGYLDIPDEMLIPTEDVDKARADRADYYYHRLLRESQCQL